jgi:hypothetical protein
MLLACSGSVLVRLSRTPERDFSSRWRLPKSNGGGSSDDGESDNTMRHFSAVACGQRQIDNDTKLLP